MRVRDLPNLSEEDIRMHERGRAAAAIVAVVLVNALLLLAPAAPTDRELAASQPASAESL